MTQVICPKAETCKKRGWECSGKHYLPHSPRTACSVSDKNCPACVLVKEEK